MKLIFSILAAILCLTGVGRAEERIALIIGNGSYTSVSPLDNPVADAGLMAGSLEQLDFKVTLLTDTTADDMKRAISEFGRTLRAAGPDAVGLFYYAGHGVQSFGANYLLPTDARLSNAADLGLVALEADSVLRQMRSARNRTNIVILDACRNNPFSSIPDLDDNGLAEMNAPTGTYLSYATAPGSVALDGLDGNSPFTKALAVEMQNEGASIEEVFKSVRNTVLTQTAGAQTPWDTSSLTSDFVFKVGVQLTSEEVAEQQLWRSVEVSDDPVQVMLFLRTYPEGRFEAEARQKLRQLMAGELAPAEAVADANPVAPAPSPQVTTPGASEADLIEAARSSGLLADYEAYLDAFPSGVFSELAKLEISSIRARAEAAPTPAPPTAPETEVASAAQTRNTSPVLYGVPLENGVPEIRGLTIEEVVAQSPLFSPIEGLPDELWKGQKCANCHEWTREALCTQATTYLSLSAQRSLNKQHPFGGSFKSNLKSWAAGGCE